MPGVLLGLLGDWRVWAAIMLAGAALWLRHSGAESVRQEMAAASARADRAEREKEQGWAVKQTEAKNVHAREMEQVVLDRDAARGAVERLRGELAKRKAGAGAGAGSCSAADAEAGDVLGNCAERYQWVAGEADKARTAGFLCERSYDAISARAKVRQGVRQLLEGAQNAKD